MDSKANRESFKGGNEWEIGYLKKQGRPIATLFLNLKNKYHVGFKQRDNNRGMRLRQKP